MIDDYIFKHYLSVQVKIVSRTYFMFNDHDDQLHQREKDLKLKMVSQKKKRTFSTGMKEKQFSLTRRMDCVDFIFIILCVCAMVCDYYLYAYRLCIMRRYHFV